MSSCVRSKCFKGKGKGKRAPKELEGNGCKDAIIRSFSVYAQILRVMELSPCQIQKACPCRNQYHTNMNIGRPQIARGSDPNHKPMKTGCIHVWILARHLNSEVTERQAEVKFPGERENKTEVSSSDLI